MIDLKGRVALVTGSAQGIGRACALKLAEAGSDVIVNYVTSKSAATEVGESILAMGQRCLVIKADVTERFDVEEMIQAVREEFGTLDIIVSNAATGGFRPLLATSDRNFEAAMQTNARALLYLVQSSIELLADHAQCAKVIALSSHGSHMALPMYGTIGASKAALESMIRQFAYELGRRNINFNVVKAGLVETASTSRLPGSGQMFEGRKDRSLVGERVLMPDDVANTVLFLSSPLSDMIQGETLTVDAGTALHV